MSKDLVVILSDFQNQEWGSSLISYLAKMRLWNGYPFPVLNPKSYTSMFRRIRIHRSPPVRSLSTRHAVKRFSSEKATKRTRKDRWEDVASDPRPPWVYSTSAGLRLVLIPSAYSFYWEIRRICSSVRKVFYFMLYFLQTSVIGSTSSCRYVDAA